MQSGKISNSYSFIIILCKLIDTAYVIPEIIFYDIFQFLRGSIFLYFR